MRVEFTDFAKSELQRIFDYYVSVASKEVALKIINHILDDAEELGRLPSIGTLEPLLTDLGKNHRYIVCGNYKMLFYSSGKTIFVTDIFDCRQNPEKMFPRNI